MASYASFLTQKPKPAGPLTQAEAAAAKSKFYNDPANPWAVPGLTAPKPAKPSPALAPAAPTPAPAAAPKTYHTPTPGQGKDEPAPTPKRRPAPNAPASPPLPVVIARPGAFTPSAQVQGAQALAGTVTAGLPGQPQPSSQGYQPMAGFRYSSAIQRDLDAAQMRQQQREQAQAQANQPPPQIVRMGADGPTLGGALEALGKDLAAALADDNRSAPGRGLYVPPPQPGTVPAPTNPLSLTPLYQWWDQTAAPTLAQQFAAPVAAAQVWGNLIGQADQQVNRQVDLPALRTQLQQTKQATDAVANAPQAVASATMRGLTDWMLDGTPIQRYLTEQRSETAALAETLGLPSALAQFGADILLFSQGLMYVIANTSPASIKPNVARIPGVGPWLAQPIRDYSSGEDTVTFGEALSPMGRRALDQIIAKAGSTPYTGGILRPDQATVARLFANPVAFWQGSDLYRGLTGALAETEMMRAQRIYNTRQGLPSTDPRVAGQALGSYGGIPVQQAITTALAQKEAAPAAMGLLQAQYESLTRERDYLLYGHLQTPTNATPLPILDPQVRQQRLKEIDDALLQLDSEYVALKAVADKPYTQTVDEVAHLPMLFAWSAFADPLNLLDWPMDAAFDAARAASIARKLIPEEQVAAWLGKQTAEGAKLAELAAKGIVPNQTQLKALGVGMETSYGVTGLDWLRSLWQHTDLTRNQTVADAATHVLAQLTAPMQAGDAATNLADARTLVTTLIEDPAKLVTGVPLTGPGYAGVATDGLTKFGKDLVAHTDLADVHRMIQVAADDLRNMKSLRGPDFNVGEFVWEFDDLLWRTASKLRGSTPPDIPAGTVGYVTRLATPKEVKAAAKAAAQAGQPAPARDANTVIAWLGKDKAETGISPLMTPQAANEYAQNVEAQIRAARQSPVMQALRKSANVQRQVLSSMWLDLRPGHWIRNAASGTLALVSDDAYTWTPFSQIWPAFEAKFGGGAPTNRIGNARKGATRVGENTTTTTRGGAHLWDDASKARFNTDFANRMWAGMTEVLGTGIPFGEQALYTKGFYKAFTRTFERAWQDAVRTQLGAELRRLQVPKPLADHFVARLAQAGINGSRQDVARTAREMLTSLYSPVTLRQFGLPAELFSTAGPLAGDPNYGVIGLQRVLDAFARGELDEEQAWAQVQTIIDLEKRASQEILAANPDLPTTPDWTVSRAVSRQTQIEDHILNVARDAGKDPVEAAAIAKATAARVVGGEIAGWQAFITELSQADNAGAMNVAFDTMAQLHAARRAAQARVDEYSEAAADALPNVKDAAWNLKWAGTLEEYENLAAEQQRIFAQTQEDLRQLLAGNPPPRRYDWWDAIDRFAGFTDEQLAEARALELKAASGPKATDRATWKKVIDRNRAYVDSTYTYLYEAFRMYPDQFALDLILATQEQLDNEGAAAAAYLAPIRNYMLGKTDTPPPNLPIKAGDWDAYFALRNRVWNGAFDNQAAYNRAAAQAIVANGVSKQLPGDGLRWTQDIFGRVAQAGPDTDEFLLLGPGPQGRWKAYHFQSGQITLLDAPGPPNPERLRAVVLDWLKPVTGKGRNIVPPLDPAIGTDVIRMVDNQVNGRDILAGIDPARVPAAQAAYREAWRRAQPAPGLTIPDDVMAAWREYVQDQQQQHASILQELNTAAPTVAPDAKLTELLARTGHTLEEVQRDPALAQAVATVQESEARRAYLDALQQQERDQVRRRYMAAGLSDDDYAALPDAEKAAFLAPPGSRPAFTPEQAADRFPELQPDATAAPENVVAPPTFPPGYTPDEWAALTPEQQNAPLRNPRRFTVKGTPARPAQNEPITATNFRASMQTAFRLNDTMAAALDQLAAARAARWAQQTGRDAGEWYGAHFAGIVPGGVMGDDALWQKVDLDTPEFKTWFGASKAVDEQDGRPLVMYHGTGATGFDAFEVRRQNPDSLYGPGFYFTANPDIAGGVVAPRQTAHATFKTEAEAATWTAENPAYRRHFQTNPRYLEPGTEPIWWGVEDRPYLHQRGYAWRENRDLNERGTPVIPVGLRQRLAQQIANLPKYIEQTTTPGLKRDLALLNINSLAEDGNVSAFNNLKLALGAPEIDDITLSLGIDTPGTVLPVYLRVERPFDIDADYELENLRTQASALPATDWFKRALGLDRKPEDRFMGYSRGKDIYAALQDAAARAGEQEPKAAVNLYLQALGFDGITHIGGGNTGNAPHRVFIAFEPNQVKSVFNPRPTADPRLLYQTRAPAIVPSFPVPEIRALVAEAGLTDAAVALAALDGERPEYLNTVIDYLLEAREKFRTGQFKPKDAAKAYVMTLGSIQADAIGEDVLLNYYRNHTKYKRAAASIRIPDRFVQVSPAGVRTVRPEEAVAWWLTTPRGKRALDAIDAGRYEPKLWADLLTLRDAYGNNMLRNAVASNTKQKNLLDPAFFARLTQSQNPAELSQMISQLSGIGPGKNGFLKHFLGVGDTPTVDANILNYWLGGTGPEGERLARIIAGKETVGIRADGRPMTRMYLDDSQLATSLRNRIAARYGELRAAGLYPDLPDDIAVHVIHHALWDQIKGTQTTHEGLYYAMRFAQQPIGASPLAAAAKGSAEFLQDGRAILRGLNAPDVSTAVHELGHVFRRDLTDVARVDAQAAQDLIIAERWAGAVDGNWTRDAEEKFARGFEQYLQTGQAPTKELEGIFARFRQWLTDIYKALRGQVEPSLTPEMRGVYGRLLGEELPPPAALPTPAPVPKPAKAPKPARVTSLEPPAYKLAPEDAAATYAPAWEWEQTIVQATEDRQNLAQQWTQEITAHWPHIKPLKDYVWVYGGNKGQINLRGIPSERVVENTFRDVYGTNLPGYGVINDLGDVERVLQSYVDAGLRLSEARKAQAEVNGWAKLSNADVIASLRREFDRAGYTQAEREELAQAPRQFLLDTIAALRGFTQEPEFAGLADQVDAVAAAIPEPVTPPAPAPLPARPTIAEQLATVTAQENGARNQLWADLTQRDPNADYPAQDVTQLIPPEELPDVSRVPGVWHGGGESPISDKKVLNPAAKYFDNVLLWHNLPLAQYEAMSDAEKTAWLAARYADLQPGEQVILPNAKPGTPPGEIVGPGATPEQLLVKKANGATANYDANKLARIPTPSTPNTAGMQPPAADLDFYSPQASADAVTRTETPAAAVAPVLGAPAPADGDPFKAMQLAYPELQKRQQKVAADLAGWQAALPTAQNAPQPDPAVIAKITTAIQERQAENQWLLTELARRDASRDTVTPEKAQQLLTLMPANGPSWLTGEHNLAYRQQIIALLTGTSPKKSQARTKDLVAAVAKALGIDDTELAPIEVDEQAMARLRALAQPPASPAAVTGTDSPAAAVAPVLAPPAQAAAPAQAGAYDFPDVAALPPSPELAEFAEQLAQQSTARPITNAMRQGFYADKTPALQARAQLTLDATELTRDNMSRRDWVEQAFRDGLEARRAGAANYIGDVLVTPYEADYLRHLQAQSAPAPEPAPPLATTRTGQGEMFPAGEDSPLFTGSLVSAADAAPFAPPEVQRQEGLLDLRPQFGADEPSYAPAAADDLAAATAAYDRAVSENDRLADAVDLAAFADLPQRQQALADHTANVLAPARQRLDALEGRPSPAPTAPAGATETAAPVTPPAPGYTFPVTRQESKWLIDDWIARFQKIGWNKESRERLANVPASHALGAPYGMAGAEYFAQKGYTEFHNWVRRIQAEGPTAELVGADAVPVIEAATQAAALDAATGEVSRLRASLRNAEDKIASAYVTAKEKRNIQNNLPAIRERLAAAEAELARLQTPTAPTAAGNELPPATPAAEVAPAAPEYDLALMAQSTADLTKRQAQITQDLIGYNQAIARARDLALYGQDQGQALRATQTAFDALAAEDEAITAELARRAALVSPRAPTTPAARPWSISDKGKLQLDLSKEEVQALDPGVQEDIRRYYMWSRTRKAYVSKAAADNYTARKIAQRAGFTDPKAAAQAAPSPASVTPPASTAPAAPAWPPTVGMQVSVPHQGKIGPVTKVGPTGLITVKLPTVNGPREYTYDVSLLRPYMPLTPSPASVPTPDLQPGDQAIVANLQSQYVGHNTDGKAIYADKRGVRFTLNADGIGMYEPVGLNLGYGGIGFDIGVGRQDRPEYLTRAERAALPQPSPADPAREAVRRKLVDFGAYSDTERQLSVLITTPPNFDRNDPLYMVEVVRAGKRELLPGITSMQGAQEKAIDYVLSAQALPALPADLAGRWTLTRDGDGFFLADATGNSTPTGPLDQAIAAARQLEAPATTPQALAASLEADAAAGTVDEAQYAAEQVAIGRKALAEQEQAERAAIGLPEQSTAIFAGFDAQDLVKLADDQLSDQGWALRNEIDRLRQGIMTPDPSEEAKLGAAIEEAKLRLESLRLEEKRRIAQTDVSAARIPPGYARGLTEREDAYLSTRRSAIARQLRDEQQRETAAFDMMINDRGAALDSWRRRIYDLRKEDRWLELEQQRRLQAPAAQTDQVQNAPDSAIMKAGAQADAITDRAGTDAANARPLAGAPPADVRRDAGGRQPAAERTGRGGADAGSGAGPDRPRNVSAGGVGDGAPRLGTATGGGRAAGPGGTADVGGPTGTGGGGFPGGDLGPEAPAIATSATGPLHDYVITNPADLENTGGPVARYDRNLAAIRVLKTLENEKRFATPNEQRILALYAGWGDTAFKEALFGDRTYNIEPAWLRRRNELRDLLTDAEFEAARRSSLNAHYTTPTVVTWMYKALDRLGVNNLNRVRVLDPSTGAGVYFGLMPPALAARSERVGVELDSLSARITQQLYQNAQIVNNGFERAPLPNAYFDVAITNVPFMDRYDAVDPFFPSRLKFLKSALHNYYFAKAETKVRPGGVVAFVTSRYTMDNPSALRVRQYLADKFDFLGAVRLPDNAFQRNANTEVVTDVIFLRKRAPGEQPLNIARWTDTGKLSLPVNTWGGMQEYDVNEYFLMHPDMVLGQPEATGTMYAGKQYTVKARPDTDLAAELERTLMELPSGIMTESTAARTGANAFQPVAGKRREGVYYLDGGKVKVQRDNQLVDVTVAATDAERMKRMLTIRDTADQLLQAELANAPEAELARLRQTLNSQYDAYTKQHGPLNNAANRALLDGDPEALRLQALEQAVNNGKQTTWQKMDIFTQRVVRGYSRPETITGPADALALTLYERGRVDIDTIAGLLGKSNADAIADLGDAVYKDPYGDWEVADRYLSGNVRQKLAQARVAAEDDPQYARNVTALEAVQPVDLRPSEISVRLGSPWVPPEVIGSWLADLLGTADQGYRVTFVPSASLWEIVSVNWAARGSANDTSVYGTNRKAAIDIVSDLLNAKTPKVFDPGPTRSDPPVLNVDATAAARDKAEQIRQHFDRWVWADPNRAEALARIYNDKYNIWRPWRPNGAHLKFVGMTPEITMRPTQANAVWRMLQGNTLLAHEVGSGKTFTMIAGAMEARRLGLARKPVMAVKKSTYETIAADARHLYPGIKLLSPSPDAFTPANRARTMARIATGDWDLVVITHEWLEELETRPETFNAFLSEQLAEIGSALDEIEEDSASARTLERQRRSLESKFRNVAEGKEHDQTVYFDDLGIDMLMVDEAQKFKNLFYATARDRIPGLSTASADRSVDMFLKVRLINRLTGGRGVTFATGTPILNTISELYTMQKYLQYDLMQEMGLLHFDNWASNYADAVTVYEMSMTGATVRPVTKFTKFTNVPELYMMTADTFDWITMEDVIREAEKQGITVTLPKVKRIPVVAASNDNWLAFINNQERRLANLPKQSDYVPGTGMDHYFKVHNDGKFAAVDLRLAWESDDAPNSKVNQLIGHVLDVYNRTNAERGTQVIFSDIGVPSKLSKQRESEGLFADVYADVVRKLVAAGIPANEIGIVHDAKSDKAIKALLDKANKGEIRVVLGSTEKLGVGTNFQRRLKALHHLDVLNRPGDMWQREGRIVRQGNMWDEVEIYQYLQEPLDSYNLSRMLDKARAFDMFRKGDSAVRDIEDVDEHILTMNEWKALASGNPLITALVKAEDDLNNLSSLRRAWIDQVLDEKRRLGNAEWQIRSEQERQTYLRNLIDRRTADRLALGATTFKERRDLLNAVEATLQTVNAKQPGPVAIGAYRGYPLTATWAEVRGPRGGTYHALVIKAQVPDTGAELFAMEAGQRVDDTMSMVDHRLNDFERQLTYSETQQAQAQAVLNELNKVDRTEWPRQAEYDATQAEVARIRQQLGANQVDQAATAAGGAGGDDDLITMHGGFGAVDPRPALAQLQRTTAPYARRVRTYLDNILRSANQPTPPDPTFPQMAAHQLKTLDEWGAALRQALPSLRQPLPNNLTLGQKAAITQYVDNVLLPAFDNTVLGSSYMAERIANGAMLNYNDRRGIDTLISLAIPYHYYMTRGGLAWAQRLARKPSLLNLFGAINQAIAIENERGTLPERLKGTFFTYRDANGQVRLRNPLEWLLPIPTTFADRWRDPEERVNGGVQWANALADVNLLPAYSLGLGAIMDRVDPRTSGPSRVQEDLELRRYLPQVGVLADAYQAGTGQLVPTWAGGNYWDAHRARRALADLATLGQLGKTDDENTTRVQYGAQLAHNLERNLPDRYTNIPPNARQQAEADLQLAAQNSGLQRALSSTTGLLLGNTAYYLPAAEQQRMGEVDARQQMKYDAFGQDGIPIGSAAAYQAKATPGTAGQTALTLSPGEREPGLTALRNQYYTQRDAIYAQRQAAVDAAILAGKSTNEVYDIKDSFDPALDKLDVQAATQLWAAQNPTATPAQVQAHAASLQERLANGDDLKGELGSTPSPRPPVGANPREKALWLLENQLWVEGRPAWPGDDASKSAKGQYYAALDQWKELRDATITQRLANLRQVLSVNPSADLAELVRLIEGLTPAQLVLEFATLKYASEVEKDWARANAAKGSNYSGGGGWRSSYRRYYPRSSYRRRSYGGYGGSSNYGGWGGGGGGYQKTPYPPDVYAREFDRNLWNVYSELQKWQPANFGEGAERWRPARYDRAKLGG